VGVLVGGFFRRRVAQPGTRTLRGATEAGPRVPSERPESLNSKRVNGQRDFPVGGQLISLCADR
jgi:hypothetical protein